MRNLWLVIQRELFARVWRPSYLLLTLAGPLLIVLFAILAIKIGEGSEKQKVLVIDDSSKDEQGNQIGAGFIGPYLKDSKWVDFEFSPENVSDEYFKKSPYDLILYIPQKFEKHGKVIIQYKERPSPYVVSKMIRSVEYELEKLKLKMHDIDPDAYAHVKHPVDFKVVNIDGMESEYNLYSGYAGFVFGLIIFFFIFIYGVQVMRGVIEEKSNRIVEVIVGSVKPFQLMAGKIIGIGLAAMLQFTLWMVLTGALLMIVRDTYYPDRYNPVNMEQTAALDTVDADSSIAVNDVGEIIYSAINYPLMLSYFLYFFIFGYLLYASIFAAIGAAVRSDTDSQQFLIPVLLPLILGFVASWFMIQNPASTGGEIASFVPFTSPVAMMVRIAMGVSVGPVLTSMLLLVITFLLFTYLSARIYRRGILRYGKKTRLRDVMWWLRH